MLPQPQNNQIKLGCLVPSDLEHSYFHHHLLTKVPCRLVHFVNSSDSGYIQLGISPDVWNGCCYKNIFYKLVNYYLLSSDSGGEWNWVFSL